MRRYLPGFPDFGTRDKGEDWNGPILCSRSLQENGPIYLPLLNSDCIISRKVWESSSVNSLFMGVNVRVICGKPASAPFHMDTGILLYLSSRFAVSSASSHLSTTSGVSRWAFLCETALLRSMCEFSTTGAFVYVVSGSVLATGRLVPVVAEGSSVVVDDASVVRAHATSLVFSVPKGGELACSDVVTHPSETDWANGWGERFRGVKWFVKPAGRGSWSRRSGPGRSDPCGVTVATPTPAPLSILALRRVPSRQNCQLCGSSQPRWRQQWEGFSTRGGGNSGREAKRKQGG